MVLVDQEAVVKEDLLQQESGVGLPGTINIGGGGGGGARGPGCSGDYNGGSGGSGIVIIRYKYQ
jgi:hypothetical protein